MFDFFKLKSPIGRSYNTDPGDVVKTKKALNSLGYYDEPAHGITPYPDPSLIRGIEEFQRDNGLRIDGVMKPDGETMWMLGSVIGDIFKDAQNLQSLGRNGDSILAHISPKEARMLKSKGGAGTIHPITGLLEFSDAAKKEGKYIWHTVGDGKVRSSHAERDGKTFSWDDPPEGGHPGEAPNCRCWAEDTEEPNCLIERLDLEKIVSEHTPKEAELSELERQIHNLNLLIRENQNIIRELERAADGLRIGSAGSSIPNPITKIVGYGSEAALAVISIKLNKAEAELSANVAKREELEQELSKLEKEVESLRNREQIARQAYEKCMGK